MLPWWVFHRPIQGKKARCGVKNEVFPFIWSRATIQHVPRVLSMLHTPKRIGEYSVQLEVLSLSLWTCWKKSLVSSAVKLSFQMLAHPCHFTHNTISNVQKLKLISVKSFISWNVLWTIHFVFNCIELEGTQKLFLFLLVKILKSAVRML